MEKELKSIGALGAGQDGQRSLSSAMSEKINKMKKKEHDLVINH
jgi:hypothetical protein